MKFQTFATPCEVFSRGEVEDYTVIIVGQKNAEAAIDNSSGNHELFVYPNPATSSITANLSGWQGTLALTVYDVTGSIIHSSIVTNPNQFTLNVAQWKNGMYVLRITDEIGITQSVKWIKN